MNVVSTEARCGRLTMAMVMALCFASGPVRAADAPAGAASASFAQTVQPLLSDRCVSCHGESRRKGGLSLHTPAAITEGGDDGPVVIAGKPEKSELVRRLRLPVDDDGHMPPRSKPQLTEDEIKLIEAWIAAGASFDKSVTAAPAAAPQPPTPLPAAQTPSAAAVAPADAAALAALRENLVSVELVAQGSHRLRVNLAAAARRLSEPEIIQLIKPVLPQLEGISLARSKAGDATAALLATAPLLRDLDLRSSGITDRGVESLTHLASLRDLVLAQTHLTDASAAHVLAMPKLERVYLWKAGLSAESIARIRRERPSLRVDAGEPHQATTREAETQLKITSDAPPPVVVLPAVAAPQSQPAPPVAATKNAPPAQVAASQPAGILGPINSACPVSGKPVDARYVVVHQGRLVGFCCPHCPEQFWADPAKFAAKLTATPGAAR